MTRAAALSALAAAAAASVAVARSGPALLLVNESASVPRGLYARSSGAVAADSLVALRPPPEARRYLATLGAGADARLLKRVAAVAGEVVCRRKARLTWPRGDIEAFGRDRQGRPLPTWEGCRTLASDELLVIGDTPSSFDSRYFGPVRASDVEGVYREIWRW